MILMQPWSALGWYGSWDEKGHGKGKRGKEEAKVNKGSKGMKKGREKGKGKSNSGERKRRAGGMSNVSRGWTDPFRGYCGHCWKWCHKNAQTPSMARTTPDGSWCNGIEPVSLTLDSLYRNVFKR